MKIPGYCTSCHKIKQVQVSSAGMVNVARRGVAMGICDACDERSRRTPMTTVTVYVPKPGTLLEKTIARGSGIVGTPQPSGRVLIDYEGNLYGAVNLQTFSGRVNCAADRHLTKYPTVARRLADASDLIDVGEYGRARQSIEIHDQEALARWLDEE